MWDFFMNELVKSSQISEHYLFGRPRKYDLGAIMRLAPFTYTRETFTS